MATTNNIKKILILITILVLPSLFYFLLYTGEHHYKKLPIYGDKTAVEKPDGSFDTTYHQIPYFELTNQDGATITRDDMLGNVYVADFFFVTCPTICPKMTTNMRYIQDKFADRKNLKFLSITVNPEHDSVPVLKEYAEKVHANTDNWDFVTGNKEEIYELAFKGFFVNVAEDSIAEGGFLHSQLLILVDKKGRVRGYFDGTVYSEMKKDLTDAIDILFREEAAPLKGEEKLEIEQKRN
ncbi:MAG TPA: SCO family protein [Vicingaceae bacterium]|jgi:protein SCO1/2|nr:SCO family protein [Vicingaceae bacterium]